MSRRGTTAIVVSRGLTALLAHGLRDLARALDRAPAAAPWEIVVVDNATLPPYRPERLSPPATRVLRFDAPRSFAHANNRAAAAFPAERYLLVNNDVLLGEETVASMIDALEARSAGICGTRLLFPDGTVQHAGVVFGDGNVGPYHRDRGRPSEVVPRGVAEVQAVTGACMMIRHSVWESLGGLCEDYPFGLEDVDFCLRARQLGWRILCDNRTESLHFESMTPGRAELDVPSRALFMSRWSGLVGVDG